MLTGDWQALYDEVRAFRAACGPAHMKTILATAELATLRNVAQASLVCMMAGADFIKTSTGKETVNATLPVGITMVRALREYYERTGYRVGFKPAGGIRTAKQALDWLILMKEELDPPWLTPALFRLGASSLLTDIERQLAALPHRPLRGGLPSADALNPCHRNDLAAAFAPPVSAVLYAVTAARWLRDRASLGGIWYNRSTNFPVARPSLPIIPTGERPMPKENTDEWAERLEQIEQQLGEVYEQIRALQQELKEAGRKKDFQAFNEPLERLARYGRLFGEMRGSWSDPDA